MRKFNILLNHWPYWLLLFIEGASLMVVEIIGAKLLAPFYGSSLYVWTAILTITTLGLSLGYFLGGQIAEKKRVHIYLITIVAIAAIFISILPIMASFAIKLTAEMDLVLGICIAATLLLIPPMLLFGLVGPLVVRLLSINQEKLRDTASVTYFVSTIGGIAATFLFGYYIVPYYGLIFSSKVMASLLAFSVFMLMLKYRFVQKENNVSIEEPISHPKKVTNIPIPKKSIYWYAVIEGSSVMAIELISALMLAPYFGNSLYVWVAVIGVTLASLSIGYFMGGKLAHRLSGYNSLYWVLLFAAICISFMHIISKQLTLAFTSVDISSAVVLISIFLIMPPLIFLGMIPTMLIRLLAGESSDSGSTTGKVFAISAASGILILPIVGFYIIPNFGLTNPSILIALLLGIFPLIKLFTQKKYASLLFILCLFISLSKRSVALESKNVTVQYYSEGILGQILVADVFNNNSGNEVNDRLLFVNRMGQTSVSNANNATNFNYMVFGSAIVSQLTENSTALLLGLGGGSVANMLHENLKMKVDAVELDERMVTIAQNYFSLNPNVNVIVDDARHYVEITKKKYDCVFFDVFKGDVMPAHVLSIECFNRVKSILNKDGIVVINFHGFLTGKTGVAGRSVYKTLLAAGFNTYVLPTPGKENERNTLFVASLDKINFSTLRFPLLHDGKPEDINKYFMSNSKIDMSNTVVLNDDRPELDMLNIDANQIWRKSYNAAYAVFFNKNGIPLFN